MHEGAIYLLKSAQDLAFLSWDEYYVPQTFQAHFVWGMSKNDLPLCPQLRVFMFKQLRWRVFRNLSFSATVFVTKLIWECCSVQVWNEDSFSKKNTFNSEEWWEVIWPKYAPSLVTHFPIFRAICEYYDSKNHLLLLRTIHRAIFSHLRTNQSATQQVRDPSMQTSLPFRSTRLDSCQVWWVSPMG